MAVMAEEREEWKLPKLTTENHDAWFRRNKIKLKGKRVFLSDEMLNYRDDHVHCCGVLSNLSAILGSL
jgi:hypothetical protein